MVKHNNVIPNQHFKKKWQFRVKTWFNQPARKERRRIGAPRPQPPPTMLPPSRASLCSGSGVARSHWTQTHRIRPLPAARAEKAAKVFPRPVAGLLRPVVRGQTLRYNTKRRVGRGFTHEELKVPLAVPHLSVAVVRTDGNNSYCSAHQHCIRRLAR